MHAPYASPGDELAPKHARPAHREPRPRDMRRVSFYKRDEAFILGHEDAQAGRGFLALLGDGAVLAELRISMAGTSPFGT